MSNVYRLAFSKPQLGPFTICPQCGATAVWCPRCGDVRTDKTTADFCFRTMCPAPGNNAPNYEADNYYLAYEYDTDPIHRLCSPDRRIRYGFLWLKRCSESGVHVHQRCQRCRWRGTALVISRE